MVRRKTVEIQPELTVELPKHIFDRLMEHAPTKLQLEAESAGKVRTRHIRIESDREVNLDPRSALIDAAKKKFGRLVYEPGKHKKRDSGSLGRFG
jgi:hypothetical protein